LLVFIIFIFGLALHYPDISLNPQVNFVRSKDPDLNLTLNWNLIDNPIYIDDRSPYNNWNLYEAFFPWCTGEGTEANPYIIQNIIISSKDSDCITILHSEVYFIIRNCYILSSQKKLGDGIHLYNVKNGEISYCQISNSVSSGISMIECTDMVIRNNTIFNNNWEGIYLFKCRDTEIVNNTIFNNSIIGLSIFMSNFTEVINNDISFHYEGGIIAGQSSETQISTNYVHENKEGIFLYKSSHNIISQNNITSNNESGILLKYDSHLNTIKENVLSENKYCITIGTSCINNVVSNNGDCNKDGREIKTNNHSLSIPGYVVIFFLILFSGSVVLLIRETLRNLKLNL